MQIPLVHQLIHEIAVTVIIAIGGSALMWPYKAIKKEFAEAKSALEAVHEELLTQRMNCLTTLKTQGDTQIEVLKEVASTLKDMHLDQRTLLGRLDK
jgi:hypothetical protein